MFEAYRRASNKGDAGRSGVHMPGAGSAPERSAASVMHGGRAGRCGTRILSLLLILLLAITAAGCGDTAASAERETDMLAPDGQPYAKGNPVRRASGSYVLPQNNIELETISIESDSLSGQYFQIDGLKDQEVEKEINAKLRQKFDEMCDSEQAPPYRGIQVKLRDYEKPSSIYVSMYPAASFGNILSVSITKSVDYSGGDMGFGFSYSDALPLNIDLNTGRDIRLADLFSDETDYIAYINAAVNQQLVNSDATEEGWFSMSDDVKLASPFTTIKPDQKYMINAYDGSLTLILDYETPEFYCNFYQAYLNVDMLSVAAYDQRFFDGSSIYENEEINYTLMMNPYEELQVVSEEDSGYPYGENVNFSYWKSRTYYEDMPEKLKLLIREDSEVDEDYLAACYERYQGFAEQYGAGNTEGFIEMSAWSGRFGEYTYLSLQRYENYYMTSGDWDNIYSGYGQVYSSYRGANAEPLTLDDIFVKDADRRELLKAAFLKVAEREYEELVYAPDVMDAYLEDALDAMTGFYLAGDSIQCSYSDLSEVAVKYFPDNDDLWQYTMICSYAYYKDIGCDNLTIF